MPLLETVDITVHFGGNVALDQVSIGVEPGTITGLIGPNRAGDTSRSMQQISPAYRRPSGPDGGWPGRFSGSSCSFRCPFGTMSASPETSATPPRSDTAYTSTTRPIECSSSPD